MAGEEIIIRDMTEDDIAGMLAIDQEIVGAERVLTYKNPKSPYVGGEVGLSKVAEFNGKIVGFATGYVTTPPDSLTAVGFLNLMGVLPQHQRKGIASKLITAFMKTCRDRKIGQVNTLISLNDKQMCKLFKSAGFFQNDVVEFSISTGDIE
jgi:GNAT superfamily N-acetyltransferase